LLLDRLTSGIAAKDRVAAIDHQRLLDFIRESNRIENIRRRTKSIEVTAHREFLALDEVSVHDLELFVKRVAGKPLRRHEGMNVSIVDRGSGRVVHAPPPGGPAIEGDLRELLIKARSGEYTPYQIHCAYETLHPFLDGNGRSGRVLWAWQMLNVEGKMPFGLPFLHSFYYQALSGNRR
jgi:Fic family protein